MDPEVGGSSPPSCTTQFGGRWHIIREKLSCFKTYDVRGRVGFDLDEKIAYRIGRAFAQHLDAKRIAIGCDARLSSPSLKAATIAGLLDAGADVIDLGLTGTEEIYFASFHLDVDGGIEVTASHNPADYNGMKFVGRKGRPLSIYQEFAAVQQLAEANIFETPNARGHLSHASILQPYVDHLLSYIDVKALRPMKLVMDSGSGAAGHVIDAIEQRFEDLDVPVQFAKINHGPDGHFPNGVPNPLIPENRSITSQAVKANAADMGIAWDGDFDRCFLFDSTGEFVSGYYVAGLLMNLFLVRDSRSKFIIDPRLIWNSLDCVSGNGATVVPSRTGHTFFKEAMRRENAIYGGESSSHHYFRDFAYCDSGMIPWLLIIEHLSKSKKSLREIVQVRKALFPCSEEINFKVRDVKGTLDKVQNHYREHATHIDFTDGIGMEFENWRFNLRGSNTEALLRLNVEARGNAELVEDKVKELTRLIQHMP